MKNNSKWRKIIFILAKFRILLLFLHLTSLLLRHFSLHHHFIKNIITLRILFLIHHHLLHHLHLLCHLWVHHHLLHHLWVHHHLLHLLGHLRIHHHHLLHHLRHLRSTHHLWIFLIIIFIFNKYLIPSSGNYYSYNSRMLYYGLI